jgi:hypothetical protein
MAGRMKARRRQLKAQSWAARGGQMQWDSVVVRPGSIVAGWERERTSGTHASARGEREDIEDGRRESKRKTHS